MLTFALGALRTMFSEADILIADLKGTVEDPEIVRNARCLLP